MFQINVQIQMVKPQMTIIRAGQLHYLCSPVQNENVGRFAQKIEEVGIPWRSSG